MSKLGKGCTQPVKGSVELGAATIAAICQCITDAGQSGIELGATQVGCIKNASGVTTGAVFICVEKSEDGLVSSTIVKSVNYADGVITSPYTGVISECENSQADALATIALEELCANVDGNPQAVVPVVTINQTTGTPSAPIYLDEMGNLITGVVTVADPCDCPCVECP